MIKNQYVDDKFFVIEYESGAIVKTLASQDTEITSDLNIIKELKIQELENKCTEIKNGGFTSSCLGIEKIFDSSPENRNLIMGLAMKASLLANGAALTDTSLEWKAKDEPVCYSWTPQQVIMLGVDMSTFLTNTIKRKEQLQEYVRRLEFIEEIQAVDWDTEIPSV